MRGASGVARLAPAEQALLAHRRAAAAAIAPPPFLHRVHIGAASRPSMDDRPADDASQKSAHSAPTQKRTRCSGAGALPVPLVLLCKVTMSLTEFLDDLADASFESSPDRSKAKGLRR